MRIVSLDDELPAALLRSWHALRAATDLELEPHVPPPGLEEAFASATSDPLYDRHGWLVVDGETAVAHAIVEFSRLDNPQLAELELRVDDAAHRRAGNATRLLRLATRAAHDAGRRSIVAEAVDGSAGDKACAAWGAVAALGSTSSTLRLASVDDLLAELARRPT